MFSAIRVKTQKCYFKNTVCIYTIDDVILGRQYSKTTSNTLMFTICITTTQKNKIFTSNRNNQQCYCCIANKSIKAYCSARRSN